MERRPTVPPAVDAGAKSGQQSLPPVARSAARSQEPEPLLEHELPSSPPPAAAASAAAATAAAMSGVRRPMSWRRGSMLTGSARADPRRRASSLADEMEALRRKAAGGGGSSAGGAWEGQQGDRIAEEEELTLLHFQDVREELELSGHNLTSVLNNPRETFMDSLYEAAFEAEPPLPDLEVVRANVPHGLREITPQDVKPFIRRTGALTRAFERNHLPSAGRGHQEGGKGGGGSGGGGGGGRGGNGLSSRRRSGSDVLAAGAEEAPRYGLGIRRFRSSNNATDAAAREAAAVTAGGAGAGAGAAAAPSSVAAAAAAAAAVANGGTSGSKRGEHDLGGGGSVAQCFEQVPVMFFDKDFSLQDSTVFEDAVMAAGAEQPERLAHYLDLVEVCLLKQISHRSNAFFEGLKTSQDLQMHVTGACTTLYQLRESMRCMQHDVLAGPMRVPQLQGRRSNLSSLESTLELITRVQQSQAAIQGLLAAEDYLGALDILQSAKRTVNNELGKLQSLKHVGRQLEEYETLVSELLNSRFVNLAVTIPVDGATTTTASTTTSDADAMWEANERGTEPTWGASATSTSNGSGGGGCDGEEGEGKSGGVIAGGLRRDLDLVVRGLLRLGEMETVLGVVQERVSDDLKLIIRTVVGDFLATTDDSGELMDTFHLFGDETGGGGGGDGAEGREGGGGEDNEREEGGAGQSVAKLKTLDGEAFCSCLEMCFEHMLSVLTRVSLMHEALTSIIDACLESGEGSPSGFRRDADNGGVDTGGGKEGGGGRGGEAVVKRVTRWNGTGDAAAEGNRSREEGRGRRGEEGEARHSEEVLVTKETGEAILERSRSCLRALSELMERSISQLLSVRREHNCTKLDVEELKHLWDITVAFVQSVERLSGSNGYKLRSTLLSQAKSFVEARHEANKKTLVKRLDAEKWTQADVTPDRQAVLDRLSGGQVLPAVSSSSSSSSPRAGAAGGGGGGREGGDGSAYGNGVLRAPGDPPSQPNFVGGTRSGRRGGRGERREASVGGANYKTVGSALLVAEMSVGFLQFAAHFPAIVTDVLTRLGELLRVFNSRSTQLVLGAGAIHSTARLKSISAKHLALCCQSIDLVRSLMPYLKAALATRLPQKHHLLLAQMDAVAQDYRDHRDKILSKFVSMIDDLIDARSSTLKLTDWDMPGGARGDKGAGRAGAGAGSAGEPCQFTADVRKAVTAMHNILHQQLPQEQLQAVFRRMFGVITRKVPACFKREGVSPSTAAGRQRILDDIGFACAALSTLRGVDASSLGLEQAIADIYGKGIDGGGGGGSVVSGDRSSPRSKDGGAAPGSVMAGGR